MVLLLLHTAKFILTAFDYGPQFSAEKFAKLLDQFEKFHGLEVRGQVGGQGTPCSHHSVLDLFWQHGGSALMLLVGRLEGLLVCRNFLFKTPCARIKVETC